MAKEECNKFVTESMTLNSEKAIKLLGKIPELVSELDYWKRRAEALERAIKTSCSCKICAFYKECVITGDSRKGTLIDGKFTQCNDSKLWKFDEDRFTKGGAGE